MGWAQGPETGGYVCPSPHLHVSHVHTHPCERHGRLEKILSMVMFLLFSFPPAPIFVSQRGANEWEGGGGHPRPRCGAAVMGRVPLCLLAQSSPSEG